MSTTLTLINSPTFGQFVFDAVFSTEHSSNITVTQHPVQSGASVSDHAYREPDEVRLEIGMSDAAVFAGDTSHSVNAYTQLRAIMEQREPITLITRLRTYQNMVITSMTVPDDYTTMNALKASIALQEVRIVSVATIRVQQTISGSKTTQSTGGTSKGSAAKSSSSAGTSSGSTSSKKKKTSVLKQIATAGAKNASTTKTTKAATKPSPNAKLKAVAMLK